MSRGTIEITTNISCKLACIYCPIPLLAKQYGKKEQMSMETFQTCLSKVPKDISITFSGYSECFLNPLAPHMMAYAHKEGYTLSLYTTLTGFHEDYLKILEGIPFEGIVLHLPDQEGNMKGAKVDDEYIYHAHKFYDKVVYTSAICYGTLHEKLKPIFHGCNEVPYKCLHRRAENVTTEKVGINHTDRIQGKITCGVASRHKMDVIRINVLLPNGDIQLCCMDYGLEHKLGNLLVDNYEDLFTSEAYKKVEQGFMDDTLDILCRDCHEAVNV